MMRFKLVVAAALATIIATIAAVTSPAQAAVLKASCPLNQAVHYFK